MFFRDRTNLARARLLRRRLHQRGVGLDLGRRTTSCRGSRIVFTHGAGDREPADAWSPTSPTCSTSSIPIAWSAASSSRRSPRRSIARRPRRRRSATRQQRALAGVEQLSDIAINAVSQKDKAIAVGRGRRASRIWRSPTSARRSARRRRLVPIGAAAAAQPRLRLAGRASRVDDLERKRVWLEWKVLRQYQSIYNEALGEMPDINHLIAINTRYIGEAALAADDAEALDAGGEVLQHLPARDAQRHAGAHRLQRAQPVPPAGRARARARAARRWSREIAFYFKYYGADRARMDLGFVTETVAYDLATLCERAFARKAPSHDALLQACCSSSTRRPRARRRRHMLRGVRKAQAKLASFYLVAGADGEPHARQIFDDMKDERPERLRSIRDELLAHRVQGLLGSDRPRHQLRLRRRRAQGAAQGVLLVVPEL